MPESAGGHYDGERNGFVVLCRGRQGACGVAVYGLTDTPRRGGAGLREPENGS